MKVYYYSHKVYIRLNSFNSSISILYLIVMSMITFFLQKIHIRSNLFHYCILILLSIKYSITFLATVYFFLFVVLIITIDVTIPFQIKNAVVTKAKTVPVKNQVLSIDLDSGGRKILSCK